MPRNATFTLSPTQELALAALLAGKTISAAAEAAGVDRTTVHRWLKEDFDFLAALNRGRQELRDALQARLLALAAKATAAVEQSIDAGDGRAALALLKGLGLLSGEPPKNGSTDPQDLAAEAANHETWRSLMSDLRRAGAGR